MGDFAEPREFRFASDSPLPELCELKFRLGSLSTPMPLICRLLFSPMEYQRKGVVFEVGVSRAFLCLHLEGCEVDVVGVFGEGDLGSQSNEELSGRELKATVEGNASLSPVRAVAGIRANLGMARRSIDTAKFKKNDAAVIARSGNRWEVRALGATGHHDIDGTAIGGEQLCLLEVAQGGNRLSVVGEVLVAKRYLNVRVQRGNAVGNRLKLARNKELIVGQLLKRAMARECTEVRAFNADEFVAVARATIEEG